MERRGARGGACFFGPLGAAWVPNLPRGGARPAPIGLEAADLDACAGRDGHGQHHGAARPGGAFTRRLMKCFGEGGGRRLGEVPQCWRRASVFCSLALPSAVARGECAVRTERSNLLRWAHAARSARCCWDRVDRSAGALAGRAPRCPLSSSSPEHVVLSRRGRSRGKKA